MKNNWLAEQYGKIRNKSFNSIVEKLLNKQKEENIMIRILKGIITIIVDVLLIIFIPYLVGKIIVLHEFVGLKNSFMDFWTTGIILISAAITIIMIIVAIILFNWKLMEKK